MDLQYVGRLLLDTEEGCTGSQLTEKVIRLYILEVSFCLFHQYVKYCFAQIESSESLKLRGRKILYTYLNSALKVLLSSPVEGRGPKKKLNFVVQCYISKMLEVRSSKIST